MKIPVIDIPESPKEAQFSENTAALNELYRSGAVWDFRFPASVEVEMVYYRAGRELFFHGRFGGAFEGCCSRCLKVYSFELKKDFEFVLVPRPAQLEGRAEELSRDDLGLSYYSTEEIDLAP